jgi:hypothetical protein
MPLTQEQKEKKIQYFNNLIENFQHPIDIFKESKQESLWGLLVSGRFAKLAQNELIVEKIKVIILLIERDKDTDFFAMRNNLQVNMKNQIGTVRTYFQAQEEFVNNIILHHIECICDMLTENENEN